MVEVHGAGDPTGRGEAFSFIKRSMKGVFLRAGETEEDRAKESAKDGEKSSRVNTNEQWGVYREEINRIWSLQLSTLANPIPPPVTEEEIEAEQLQEDNASQMTNNPMSPMSLPNKGRDDERSSKAEWDDDVSSMTGSLGSRSMGSQGAGAKNKYMVIRRLVR